MNQRQYSKETHRTIHKRRYKETSAFHVVAISVLGGLLFTALLFVFYQPNTEEARHASTPTPYTPETPNPNTNAGQPFSAADILRTTVLESSTQQESEDTASLTAQFYDRFNVQPDDVSLQMGYFEHEDALNVFIEQYISDLDLPGVTERDITISSHSGREAVISYISAMSAERNEDLYAVELADIDRAFSAFVATQNPALLTEVIAHLTNNIATFKAIPVPEEAVPLHILYVSAYMVFAKHVEGLLSYQSDPVRALASATVIADLEQTFEEIETRLAELLKDIPQYPVSSNG